MPDFPTPQQLPLFITSFSNPGGYETQKQGIVTLTLSSQAWRNANEAIYIPFYLPWPYPVNRVFWGNGSVVASSNWDFGVYTQDGTRIYSTTSTAASGASVLQYVSPTPFILAPGRYYMALVNNGTTNRSWGNAASSAALLRIGGVLQQASALPLPATATFALNTATVYPLFGFTRTASGF